MLTISVHPHPQHTQVLNNMALMINDFTKSSWSQVTCASQPHMGFPFQQSWLVCIWGEGSNQPSWEG